jgi:hypothetical protein
MARRIARSATTDGIADVLAAVGVGAAVTDRRVPTGPTEGVATEEPADASVDLGGAIGHLRIPRADLTHVDAVARDRATSGGPSSGGTPSGGATEAYSFPRRSTAGLAHRVRGFAAVRT